MTRVSVKTEEDIRYIITFISSSLSANNTLLLVPIDISKWHLSFLFGTTSTLAHVKSKIWRGSDDYRKQDYFFA